jgi:glycosyltransferase involved in cell wall biosynthesis
MKLLLSSYCFAPDAGSEQGIGWYWAIRCAEAHDVTVLTCKGQKALIEWHASELPKNLRIIYVKGPRRVSPSGGGYRFERARQYFWQLRAAGVVRRLLKQESFDLAHHLTPGTWRQASCFAFCDIPYIFGPTSGSECLPPGFLRYLGLRGLVWEKLREVSIAWAKIDPLVTRTMKRAEFLLAKGPATYADLKARYPERSLPFYRSYGLDITLAPEPSGVVKEGPPLRVAWSGRLVARKGLELLFDALRDPRLAQSVAYVIGDGPNRPRYERLTRQKGLRDRVKFLGQMERSKALRVVSECDVFAFTSLHDMYGWALAEAMELAIPSVILDWSGPTWIAGEDGCRKVPVTDFRQTSAAFAQALVDLLQPLPRETLAKSGQARIRMLTDPEGFALERDRIYEDALRKARGLG